MKKRWLSYVIFGLVFYLLFLIVEMPASWFAWGLNRYTKGSIFLDPTAGSLWSGTGRLVTYYPQNVPHDLGNANWRINPFWLLMGRFQMHWQSVAQEGRIDTTIRLSAGKIEVLETEAHFPAQYVSTFYPAADLISPQGRVLLHIDELTMANNEIKVGSEIQWKAAASSLTSVQPLGDYRLGITSADKKINLKLSTLQGALDLTGQGHWQIATGEILLNGTATPREHTDELEPLLKLLGDNQGGGKRSFAMHAQLPALLPFGK